MSEVVAWIWVTVAVIAFETLVFIPAAVFKNNGFADIAWGMGFSICALFWISTGPEPSLKHWLFFMAVQLWALRLTVYLWIRNKNKPEDFRYANWRRQWGRYALLRSYFQVFILQGLILLINQLPLAVMLRYSSDPIAGTWFRIGFAVWMLGWLWESIADLQLYVFKKNPANKGKVMNLGLWKFHRHPNYFGEIVLWWGLWLMSADQGYGLWSLPGALLITWLLTRVSGVPMLEAKYKNNPQYLEYIRTTPALIPKWK